MKPRKMIHMVIAALLSSAATGNGILDEHEVTNAEYAEFVRASGRGAPEYWQNDTYPAGTADDPVVLIDWYDAAAYCSWAGGRRLPTTSEFLSACLEQSLTKRGDIWEWTSTEIETEEGPYKALCGPQGVCDCSHRYRPHWKNSVKGFRCARETLNVTFQNLPSVEFTHP